jgi:S1-C subfamily serine protease
LAKRRGKGGFIVESFPGKAGGAWGGLRVGDVILSIGGRTIRNMVDFKARLKELAVPDSGNRSIYFLREGLGYERNIGQGKPGVRVIEVPENEGL